MKIASSLISFPHDMEESGLCGLSQKSIGPRGGTAVHGVDNLFSFFFGFFFFLKQNPVLQFPQYTC